ncbi:hypothetical protein B0H16DRAFT_1537897 [Mycena metata]|uniref:F-box domain-containing protein n=1 Tax=Mycena metata TaxID=1033252 RepID=A0AAD7J4N9_9AGAR|nr:hypothetical protein B0H16DRAFT_1537897 [Mycena metata]
MTVSLSEVPVEIWQEIITHNSEDVPSLRALCLTSRMIRSWAIEHLFSAVSFSWAQDISWWNIMVGRTPSLQTIVRKVRFAGNPSAARRRPGRYPIELHDAVDPLRMLTMPNVHAVAWDVLSGNFSLAIQYLTLFPNMNELRLINMGLNDSDDAAQLLGACGRLRVLSVRNENLFGDREDRPKSRSSAEAGVPQIDLTALEELTFIDCSPEEIFLYELMEKSRPFHLKSLTFRGEEDQYPVRAMEKLLRLAAPSLVHLGVNPSFDDSVVQMFSRLPAFPTLETISVALDVAHQAAEVINALGPAPHLTTLILRIHITTVQHLRHILRVAFPWCDSESTESMKSTLTRRFPLLRRISFHFFAARNSDVHFRRGLRRWMERQLRARLEETGEDVGEYLEMEWSGDADTLRPVIYNKTNGKAPWKLLQYLLEPDTEASDYESDSWNRDFGENLLLTGGDL